MDTVYVKAIFCAFDTGVIFHPKRMMCIGLSFAFVPIACSLFHCYLIC